MEKRRELERKAGLRPVSWLAAAVVGWVGSGALGFAEPRPPTPSISLQSSAEDPDRERVRYALPSSDPRDGRFLSLVDDPTGLGGQRLSLEVAVPAGRDRLRIELFDADTGRPCALDATPPCPLPLLGRWDRGTTPLVVSLYADPARRGERSDRDRVGRWGGRAGHPRNDPAGRWRADPRFVDDRWWVVEVAVDDGARASTGVAYYHLVIELEPPGDGRTVSNFKLAADVPLSIRAGTRFGLEAGAGSPPNDFPILYPGYRFGWPFDFAGAPSTYDGGFDLALDLPHGVERLTILDGDLDHGSEPEPGAPSGLPIGACSDTDDPDTVGLPPEAGLHAVAEGAQGAGRPADDHRFDALRREPCVRYRVVDPAGRSYRNGDPSGSLEWERFTISSRDRDSRYDADYAPRIAADGLTFVTGPLPAGPWRILIDGLDVGNSSFWRLEHPVCAQSAAGPACPPRGEGCTPGFWKQRRHYDSWPPHIDPATPFAAVFEDALPAQSLAAALAQGGGGLRALARHTVAALLNAAASEVGFELTETEVVALFADVHPGDRRGYESMKDRFETLNERHCPLP